MRYQHNRFIYIEKQLVLPQTDHGVPLVHTALAGQGRTRHFLRRQIAKFAVRGHVFGGAAARQELVAVPLNHKLPHYAGLHVETRHARRQL